MRFVFVVLLLIGVLNAQEQKQKATIGAGPYIQTQPYKDVSPIFVPSPVIFFDNSLFYVRWTRVGVYFLGDKQEDYAWGFSLTAQPRPNGYKGSDSEFVKGMRTRESTIEGGLAFSAIYKDLFFEMMALTDLLDRHDSWLARAELGAKYELGDFTLYPSILLMYQSEKFVDYYYGVTASEVDASTGRTLYEPQGGLQLGAQTFINYSINKNYSTLLNVRVDKITNDAAKSPLVNEEYIYSGLVSLMYTFEY